MSFIIITTFYSTLLLRPILIISSSNFIVIWIGLELRTFSFLPIILRKTQSSFSAIKYFFVQRIASVIILASFFSYFPRFRVRLLFVALIVKLGLAPFHFWLPTLVSTLQSKEILILLVWQKIGPLFIITFIPFFNFPIKIIVGVLRAGVGRFLGLKQTQWKQIFTFSSISHLGWLLFIIDASFWGVFFYFLIYSVAFVQVIINNKRNFINSSLLSFSNLNLNSLFIILSLAGLPPILGFVAKLIVIFYSLTSPIITGILILLLTFSIVRMYFYLKIFFSLSLLYSGKEIGRRNIFIIRNLIIFFSVPLIINFYKL